MITFYQLTKKEKKGIYGRSISPHFFLKREQKLRRRKKRKSKKNKKRRGGGRQSHCGSFANAFRAVFLLYVIDYKVFN
jgi:hypothetical protein